MTNEEAIILLNEMHERCNMPSATDPKRFLKSNAIDMAIQALKKQSEIVHCKDCKLWMKDVPGSTCFVGRCKLANYMTPQEGFCFFACERRTTDDSSGDQKRKRED